MTRRLYVATLCGTVSGNSRSLGSAQLGSEVTVVELESGGGSGVGGRGLLGTGRSDTSPAGPFSAVPQVLASYRGAVIPPEKAGGAEPGHRHLITLSCAANRRLVRARPDAGVCRPSGGRCARLCALINFLARQSSTSPAAAASVLPPPALLRSKSETFDIGDHRVSALTRDQRRRAGHMAAAPIVRPVGQRLGAGLLLPLEEQVVPEERSSLQPERQRR